MDIDNTKHYTTHADKILTDLLHYIHGKVDVVEPFVGEGDLLPYIKEIANNIEMYDIDSSIGIHQDTLLNPPDYKGKWVITNPPYLARNKSNDKGIYDKYGLDDLYKIAIQTLINGDVEGGILIIPINFLTDENTQKLRDEFFKKYSIHIINYFTYQIFDNTSYSICSFYFDKVSTKETILNIYNNDGVKNSITTKINGRLFSDFYATLKIKPIVGRITQNNLDKATNIKVYCIDGKEPSIRAEYNEEVFIGKNTDRTFFTMSQPEGMVLTTEQEKLIISKFNEFIINNRKKYNNLIFTNYRENNRKRIGFDIAYSILTKIILEVIHDI